jgi:hypothetical protein
MSINHHRYRFSALYWIQDNLGKYKSASCEHPLGSYRPTVKGNGENFIEEFFAQKNETRTPLAGRDVQIVAGSSLILHTQKSADGF